MSELEKLRREEYLAKRKKYIFYQQIGLVILAVLLSIFSIAYFKLNKATYVYYNENGNAIHYAYLKNNDYFNEEQNRLNGRHSYVSSLIDHMSADFSYTIKFLNADDVKYQYTYRIDEQIEILDTTNSSPLYDKVVEEKVGPTTGSGQGEGFTIEKTVEIRFNERNKRAQDFIAEYGLKDTSSTLIVRMYVSVIGESEQFAENHSDEYVTELRIPLCKLTFRPTVTSTVKAGEQKILAISGNLDAVFGVLSVISLVAFVIDVAVVLVFIMTTRDKYIDYSHKVARICNNFKSYVQKINNAFDTEGFRVLRLKEFSEMLEIRDTVQKPILMHENDDRTLTQFFIVSDGIVYLHEIMVESTDA